MITLTDSLIVKAIFVVHLVLSLIGFCECFPATYALLCVFVFVFAIWYMITPSSIEAVQMFCLMLLLSIPLECMLLGVCGSARNIYNATRVYYFTLAMAILNLLLKPVSCFILFRVVGQRTSITSTGAQRSYDSTQPHGYQGTTTTTADERQPI